MNLYHKYRLIEGIKPYARDVMKWRMSVGGSKPKKGKGVGRKPSI